MEIYILKARAGTKKYYESVEVLENMIEKPESFMGNKRKIKKDKIGKIEDGVAYGAFQITLTNKDLIQDARVHLNKSVYEYNKKHMEEYQKAVNATLNYDLGTEIKLK